MSSVPFDFLQAGHSLLDVFDLRNASVTASAARQDKIDLYIGRWHMPLAGDAFGEAQQFCEYLGTPPVHYNHDFITRVHEAGHADVHGYIFNRVNLATRKQRWKQEVRRDDLRESSHHTGELTEITPPPLFSGKMEWKITEERTRHATHSLEGSLDAQLNVTRYARHRSGTESLPIAILQRELDERFQGHEVCFDGNDNWLPLSARLHARTNPTKWPRIVGRYFNFVKDAVDGEIQRAYRVIPETMAPNIAHLAQTVNRVNFTGVYTIKRVETYWEFLSENPTALVRSLCRALQTWAARKFYHIEYPNQHLKIRHPEMNVDSVLIAADTVRGENLKIYAKTNGRIRIELRHTFTGNEMFEFRTASAGAGDETRSTSHRFTSVPEIMPFLARIQRESASVANDFLRFAAKRNPRSHPMLTGYDALFRIASLLPRHRIEARTIVQLLVENGSVSKKGRPANFQYALDILKKERVLIYEKRARKYALAPMYEYAIGAFKASWEPTVAHGRMRRRSL